MSKTSPRILAFAGSARKDSFNKKLLRVAVRAAEEAGAEVTLLDMAEYPLPLYDGDLESRDGLPTNAAKLKRLFLDHDGLMIASPEYNSSISGALKNAIDWVSRPEEGRAPLDCFAGKVAAICSAAAGGVGGMRGLVHVRAILGNIQVLVIPAQVTVPASYDAFNDDGSLKDEKKHAATEDLGRALAEMIGKVCG